MTGVVALAACPGPAVLPVAGPARRWVVFATADHPLAGPLTTAPSDVPSDVPSDAPGTAVLLGAAFRRSDNDLLLDGIRTAIARGGRLVLVHLGAGGTSLIRAAMAENRTLRGLSIELPERPSAAAAAAALALARSDLSLTGELSADPGGRIGTTAWHPIALPAAPEFGRGVAVITGGLGGLGIRAAATLAHRCGLHPVLVDGRTPDRIGPRARRWLRCMADGPTGVTVRTADVTEPAQVNEALAYLPAPPTVVLHCAGVMPTGGLSACDARDLAAAQAVKVDGLRHVLDAVDRHRLRHLVVFGSTLAETSPHGLGAYALANELLRRAALRAAASLPGVRTVVAQWSIWAGAGMAHDLGVVPQARRAGWTPIALGRGLAVLPCLLAARSSRLQLLGEPS